MTAIPAEVAAELTRLRAENARLLRLLKLTPQQTAPAWACAGGADLQVTITGLDPEASAAAIDARLGRT